MTTATSQDTEITLGTGKMLALFFGLVAICAVFFGMGVSLGRTSVRIASPELSASTSTPTAGVPPPAIRNASTTPPADMTFYNAVQGKDDNNQSAPQEASSPAPDATPAPPPANSL